jgi:hypothetical protein
LTLKTRICHQGPQGILKILPRSLSSRAFSIAPRSSAFEGGIQWTFVGHARSPQPETGRQKATGQVTSTPNESCVRQFPPRSAAPITGMLRRSRGDGNRVSGGWCDRYHRNLLWWDQCPERQPVVSNRPSRASSSLPVAEVGQHPGKVEPGVSPVVCHTPNLSLDPV